MQSPVSWSKWKAVPGERGREEGLERDLTHTDSPYVPPNERSARRKTDNGTNALELCKFLSGGGKLQMGRTDGSLLESEPHGSLISWVSNRGEAGGEKG